MPGFGRPSRTRKSSLAVWLALSAVALAGGVLVGSMLIAAENERETVRIAVQEENQAVMQAQAEVLALKRKQMEETASRKEQLVHSRVAALQAHFHSLNDRREHAKAVLGKASTIGDVDSDVIDTTVTASIKATTTAPNGLRLNTLAPQKVLRGGVSNLPDVDVLETIASDEKRFEETEKRLAENEQKQIAAISRAHSKAKSKAKRLAKLLKRKGIAVPKKLESAIGGPLIELKSGDKFLNSINALDQTLADLSRMRGLADTLPHGSPVPGKKISSRYGGRHDPFTGRRAVHGGLDFRARTGTPVLATASGRITKAGRHGGYGKLVEIDHGNGLTTRYAHLSRIHVKVGQKVQRGKRIGKVGSTGRSTGPHLHYEVRRKGRTSDPLAYVRLEKKLKPLL